MDQSRVPFWETTAGIFAASPIFPARLSNLHRSTLFNRVKRWPYLALAVAAAAVGGYLYVQGGTVLGSLFSSTSGNSGKPAPGQWRTVARPGDGFKVDLPGENKDLQVPAYNETGGSEPIHMLSASPDGDTTYAVTWQDNPPVARVSHSIDRTLYMARDGMLARTETTIVSEARGFHRDYPSLDVLARNSAGGILNARLVIADSRLYILLAVFPSSGARRERDVNRFFNSFIPSRPPGISESMPPAPLQ